VDFTLLAKKTAGPIAGGGLNRVYFTLASDILQIPDRDAGNKAVISDNIVLKSGKSWQLLYVTKDLQQLQEKGNELRDNDACSSTFEAYHPGLGEAFRQFVSEHGSDEFYLLIFDCANPYPILLGRKCSPASMKVDVDSGKAIGDMKGNTMTFTSEGPYLSAIYKGAFDPAGSVIPPDTTTPNVADGVSFVTSPNTGATVITNLLNATVGSYVILSGGSDTNPSTIQDGGNFSLAGGVTMTLDLGSFIRLFVRGVGDFVEMARG
jgi:hypothetical protein